MTRTAMTLFAALSALMITSAPGVAAAQSLHNMKTIDDGLTMIAAGDMIRKNCPTIEARMFRAFLFAQSLESKAKEAGFSRAEIEAYVNDKAEKTRVKAQALSYLVSIGVDPEAPETYCTAGLYEIERNSQIGVLLKAK